MRNANTIFTVIRDRGRRGLPLERIYRLLFNRDLYLRAYAKLYPNKGVMTQGTTPETVDGMSLEKIDTLIEALRHERYRWTPARRTHIPKANGRTRPLGIPSWGDKLLQEVIRSILEAYYEPQFSDLSHGFRPQRGCHTALSTIQQEWTGTRWFIEGDLANYFTSIDHELLIGLISESIHDGRFIRLLRQFLEAGYLENWQYHKTLSGVPQGGVLSPLLSTVYLNRFDQYVEQVLIPAFTRGGKRRANPAYKRISSQRDRMLKRGEYVGAEALRKQLRHLPSIDLRDEDYRRLRYIRYADDFLLGYVGTRAEAREIKQKLAAWLRTNLNVDLSDEKTFVTHASTQVARFLGYEIVNQQANDKIHSTTRKRQVNGRIGLRVPVSVIREKCARYERNGKPIHLPERMKNSDFTIVTEYQQEYVGIVQYYALAINRSYFSKLRWVMEQSLLKTLAGKHHTRTSKIRQKYGTTTVTADGQRRKCLEVRIERDNKPALVARFGGISLARQPKAVLNDAPYVNKNRRTELLARLLANECELCGSQLDVEVHHIRKLADLHKRGKKRSAWAKQMIAMQRKTLIVCRICHEAIHAGRPTRQKGSE